ncbi:TPA: hypothetical protein N0G48_001516 [Pseudomonas aeruginosa]|nr:hypothetical protein [Pseudomonas aeruginosa]
MLQVAIGAVLLIAGMVSVFPYPILGVPLITGGYLLVQNAPKGAAQELQGVFFGLGLLGVLATLVVGLLSILF